MLTDTDSDSDGLENVPKISSKRKFPYPPCWTNDERMNALLGPFRERSINPENYDNKIEFWKEMIFKYCQYTGSPIFSIAEAQKAFERKGRFPYDLKTVMDDFLSKKKIRTKAEFIIDPLNSWKGWAVNSFIKNPLNKAVSMIVSKSNENDTEYVILEIVQEMSKYITEILNENAGQVIRYETLKNKCLSNLNEKGLHICLHNLDYQKKIFVQYSTADAHSLREPKFIKVPKKGESITPLEEHELAIIKLEDTQKTLLSRIETIEENIKNNDELVRKYLKDGKKHLAKTYLRKKHLNEKHHDLLSNSLNNIESSLLAVENKDVERDIIGAYQIATKALKEENRKCDDSIKIVADLQDAMDDNNDLQNSLSASTIGEVIDDSELEMELAQLSDETVKFNQPKADISNNNTQSVEFTDKELLALLEGLQVEADVPKKVPETLQAFKISE